MQHGYRINLLFLLASCVVACVTSVGGKEDVADSSYSVRVERGIPPVVTVLSDPNADSAAAECLIEALSEPGSPVVIFDSDTFRAQLYPWFEHKTMPRTSEALKKLLSKKLVRKKIEELDVRYVISVTGTTDTDWSSEGGEIFCGDLSGCFGMGWYPRKSEYFAEVLDLQDATEKYGFQATVTGINIVPALGLPIPLLAPTKLVTCAKFSSQLMEFFSARHKR